MNMIDVIVSVVLVAPLIYGAVYFYGGWTDKGADQTIQDLTDRSKRDSRIG